MNAKAIQEIEEKNELKNNFIKNTYWFNPVTFFQNKLNENANADYYAFLAFRNKIDAEINKKQKQLLFDSWNKVKVDKQKYKQYLKN
jgi:ABC-2 type transport system permease protein